METTTEVGPGLEEMTPLELVTFSANVMSNIDPETMIHGSVIIKDEDGIARSGFCGCAVGTIALADGAYAQGRWGLIRDGASTILHGVCAVEHYATRDWKAGRFGGMFFAAMSRVFESEYDGCDDEGDIVRGDEDDVSRVLEYLDAVKAAIINIPPQRLAEMDDAMIEKMRMEVEPEFGRLDMTY